MRTISSHLLQKTESRKEKNAFRELRLSNPHFIDFFSNDYLGFARENSAHENNLPAGSTGSRLLGGNSEIHEHAEKFMAAFHKSESALIFNSGYAANTGLFSCLLEKGDYYIYDDLCHASIRDGIRLNPAHAWSFAHNDLNDLEKKLQNASGKKVVITESVFSMDGDFAPLKEIAGLCKKYDAAFIVDEAHAVGIFGNKGEGKVVEEKLEKEVFARIITFGKALGTHGAAVLGEESLKQFLINYSRPFIYTTALPPRSIQEILNHYKFLQQYSSRRDDLHLLISYYLKKRDAAGFKEISTPGFSAIQTIIQPGNEAVKSLSKKLALKKLDVRPILSPTVPEGKERLRICLHSFNSKSEIDLLMEVIGADL
jgi:8-amino-7-oxononanoate synthase